MWGAGAGGLLRGMGHVGVTTVKGAGDRTPRVPPASLPPKCSQGLHHHHGTNQNHSPSRTSRESWLTSYCFPLQGVQGLPLLGQPHAPCQSSPNMSFNEHLSCLEREQLSRNVLHI